MKFINPYWSIVDKMNLLQRWLIVHSILYYELDNSIISDRTYDMNARQLVELMKEATEKQLRSTSYYKAFYDFNGSTGFHLYKRLDYEDAEYLMQIALRLLQSHGREIK